MTHTASLVYVSVDSTVKNGKSLNLTILYGNGRYLTIRDSKLLLDASLAELSKAFKSTHFKDIFPHNFVTLDRLDYVGPYLPMSISTRLKFQSMSTMHMQVNLLLIISY